MDLFSVFFVCFLVLIFFFVSLSVSLFIKFTLLDPLGWQTVIGFGYLCLVFTRYV